MNSLVDGAAVWRLHATHGFPLELSLPLLADRHCLPTWDTLLDAAAADGVNVPRLKVRLREIARDTYTPDVADRICAGLTALHV